MLEIIKRDGQKVPFDKLKIINAISKANNEVSAKNKISKREITNIANNIEKMAVERKRAFSVEEIQDIVENS